VPDFLTAVYAVCVAIKQGDIDEAEVQYDEGPVTLSITVRRHVTLNVIGELIDGDE